MNRLWTVSLSGIMLAAGARAETVAEDRSPEAEELPLATLRSVTVPPAGVIDTPSHRALCATVCSSSEACVDGRCIEACDPDCREGTVCTEYGTCVPVQKPSEPRSTEAEVQEKFGHESKQRTSLVLFDPLGVAFQGVQLGYEWGARKSFIVSVRLMNTGFMSYANEPLNEFERFEYGYGVALVRRYYEGLYGNMRGFYYGFGIEAQAIAVSLPFDALRGTLKLAFLGHFGYRWAWEGFTFGFGPVVGVRTPVYSAYITDGDDACEQVPCPLDQTPRFEGYLSLELGLFP